MNLGSRRRQAERMLALAVGVGGLGVYYVARKLVKQATAYSFRNKVVVITGGSRGLGLVLARELAREGAKLAICARDPDELHRAAADLSRRGAIVVARPCDISEEGSVEDFIEFARSTLGPIDVLINNAGIIQVGPRETMTLEDYRSAMDVHLWAPLRAIRAAAPDMKARGEGRIVNISSIGGKISVPHLLPYCTSKFALAGLSQGLRGELAKDNILVTSVFPGLMRTGSPRNAEFKGRHRAEYAWFSIGDSLPLLSMNAQRAARQILNACRSGQAELVLSLPAKMAVLLNALAPELTALLLSFDARMKPSPGGIGTKIAKGKESTSAWSPSLLTASSEAAALENNEISPAEATRHAQ